MDPCQFVRVLVGNLSLKLPASPRPIGAGAGVHPSSTPCYCKIRLNKLPYQTAPAPLVASDSDTSAPASSSTPAAVFHLSQADLEKISGKSTLFGSTRTARLKVAVYSGRRGSTCGVSSGRLLGKVTLPLDLKGAEGKAMVFHSGWVSVGKKTKGAAVELNLTVRAEPDPRFVFEFAGEPECSPQVLQVQGSMKQPMFTCKFSCRNNSDLHLRSRSMQSDHGNNSRNWLPNFGSDRERTVKERKGWSVTVHDLSGSSVAMASMVTPFVASPGSDRVSRSNPGAWLILRPGDGTWKPWGRLEAWRERVGATGSSDGLGYRFDLLPDNSMNSSVSLIDSSLSSSKGGKFAIDLTGTVPMNKNGSRSGSPGCSPRGSGDFGYGLWPFAGYRGFVMSATVDGEGRCSKPTVEVGVNHVGCAEDAAAFVALAAAVDLSMDACRSFSHKLRKELSQSSDSLLR
ncbi:DUF1005 family protein (DUF1005) [Rhynchospora pubera]|uniref:DUF1005 family protein (DUF1005) n=1 Tax=Rhynchospora pubera TaxID=906938 RepID=A0AAV8BY34_9POAL|nr:DUF1005 family protein (DUF1005) [Rhynchospora pubera]